MELAPRCPVDFATAEDMVLRKIEWSRKSGESSEQQWRDVLGMLRVQANRLDTSHLREWAVRIAVVDLLERALRESA